jgi:hypothetical protein
MIEELAVDDMVAGRSVAQNPLVFYYHTCNNWRFLFSEFICGVVS